MEGKISTMVLKVDLECHLCYKKIRKTLARLQDRENIKAISYDEKNNTVTISGPFDSQRLSKKLREKASKAIKDIQIIETKEKPKDPPKAEKETPKPEPTQPKAEPTPPKAEPTPPTAEPTPPKAEPTPPKAEPTPPKAEPTPPTVEPKPPMDHGLPPAIWPACCYRPYYEWYDGGWRCCSCGRVYGWVPGGPPMAVYEEDPSASCTIM